MHAAYPAEVAHHPQDGTLFGERSYGTLQGDSAVLDADVDVPCLVLRMASECLLNRGANRLRLRRGWCDDDALVSAAISATPRFPAVGSAKVSCVFQAAN